MRASSNAHCSAGSVGDMSSPIRALTPGTIVEITDPLPGSTLAPGTRGVFMRESFGPGGALLKVRGEDGDTDPVLIELSRLRLV